MFNTQAPKLYQININKKTKHATAIFKGQEGDFSFALNESQLNKIKKNNPRFFTSNTEHANHISFTI